MIDENVVYTGYFARMKDYISSGFTRFVQISFYQPKFTVGTSLIKRCTSFSDSKGQVINLMPDRNELLNFKRDEDISRFINTYGLVLQQYDAEEVFNLFKGSILLCYEKYGDFCHRHLVSMWLQAHGFPSEEFIINTLEKSTINVSKIDTI